MFRIVPLCIGVLLLSGQLKPTYYHDRCSVTHLRGCVFEGVHVWLSYDSDQRYLTLSCPIIVGQRISFFIIVVVRGVCFYYNVQVLVAFITVVVVACRSLADLYILPWSYS